MTSEAKRIAIAKACGWTRCNCIDCGDKSDALWIPPGIDTFGHKDWCKSYLEPPDYLNDLNAMHEAEKVFSHKNTLGMGAQSAVYTKHLENTVSRTGFFAGWSWALLHATAAQRADAFLLTLGLCKPEDL